ncbi:MAG: GatB/YqeY domain-containing protein [Candidatus Marinimicrobia bacterium]|nr:GatB/YqeY domain-containing protein [Candidatus Neomarinimicrobiota bacterium]
MLHQIENDLKEALKSQDKAKLGVLRILIAKCRNKSIAMGKPLEDSEVMKVLQTAAKQHKESIKLYNQGGRNDLVEQETVELNIVEAYLPSMMTEDEIRLIVVSVIEKTGAASMADFGKVMPQVMKEGAGKIDGGVAQNLLKELLS